ncbi:g7093 [Coccomyxa viridis]|uniref:G7093 protein n=1 Tax=Coccomyxa viridis TaxID=1274662 RepID=A0ABP1FY60_9CHLO
MAAKKQISHGLKFQARAMVAITGEGGHSRWLVGTNALRDENEVVVLDYDPDGETVKVAETHSHPAEIWQLASCPADNQRMLLSVYSEDGVSGAGLWHIPEGNAPLQQRAELHVQASRVRALAWHPERPDSAVTVEERSVVQWRFEGSSAEVTAQSTVNVESTLSSGCWDPHDTNRFTTAGGRDVQLHDLRAMQQSGSISHAHSMPIRDVDFARQQDNLMATAGDDCMFRLWDLRNLEQPLAEHAAHSHWVWQARFNPAHDSLLLTSSSDALVDLWFLPSIGTRGSGGKQAAGMRGPAADGRAQRFSDHEESVYSVAWSIADPWTFASLSYDGRVSVHQVPSQTKYKILI